MYKKSKITVIYHAANAGCFVKCLLHKCIYHPEDEAVFVGYNWLKSSFGKPEKYSKFIGYDPTIGPSGKYNQETPEEALNRIVTLFEDLWVQYNVKCDEIDKIYIGSYYAEFAIYVNYKQRKHCIFEEGAGDWKKLYWENYNTFNTLIEQFNMTMYDNEYVEQERKYLSDEIKYKNLQEKEFLNQKKNLLTVQKEKLNMKR